MIPPRNFTWISPVLEVVRNQKCWLATFSPSYSITLLFSQPSKRSKTMTTATKTLKDTQHDYSDHITPS